MILAAENVRLKIGNTEIEPDAMCGRCGIDGADNKDTALTIRGYGTAEFRIIDGGINANNMTAIESAILAHHIRSGGRVIYKNSQGEVIGVSGSGGTND